MSTAFPLRPSIDYTPQSDATLALDDEAATAVFESLGSETARAILAALAEEPATTSDLADDVGTSLQNAHYHLQRLRAADLVTEAGTWYSTKGKAMTVYALRSRRLELQFDDEATRTAEPTQRRTADSSRPPTADPSTAEPRRLTDPGPVGD